MPDPQGDDQIIRLYLDNSLKNVTAGQLYVHNHESLSQPTTGVVLGDKLYFVATSNLQLFKRLYIEGKGKADQSKLAPVRIGVVDLE